jgi:hypothetical protein
MNSGSPTPCSSTFRLPLSPPSVSSAVKPSVPPSDSGSALILVLLITALLSTIAKLTRVWAALEALALQCLAPPPVAVQPPAPPRRARQRVGAGQLAGHLGLRPRALAGDGRDGLDEHGTLTLMDEVLTPDSSRYWPAESYAEGINPPSYDKQFLRDWLESTLVNGKPWDKTPPAPRLPREVIEKTSAKYAEALQRLTR